MSDSTNPHPNIAPPSRKPEAGPRYPFVVGILILVAVACVWQWAPQIVGHRSGETKIENQGAYGDLYGAVNAGFSGLALILIAFTAMMQYEELRLQRKEMIESNDAFREQNEKIQKQLEAAQKESAHREQYQWDGAQPAFALSIASENPSGVDSTFIDQSINIQNFGAAVRSVHVKQHAGSVIVNNGMIQLLRPELDVTTVGVRFHPEKYATFLISYRVQGFGWSWVTVQCNAGKNPILLVQAPNPGDKEPVPLKNPELEATLPA